MGMSMRRKPVRVLGGAVAVKAGDGDGLAVAEFRGGGGGALVDVRHFLVADGCAAGRDLTDARLHGERNPPVVPQDWREAQVHASLLVFPVATTPKLARRQHLQAGVERGRTAAHRRETGFGVNHREAVLRQCLRKRGGGEIGERMDEAKVKRAARPGWKPAPDHPWRPAFKPSEREARELPRAAAGPFRGCVKRGGFCFASTALPTALDAGPGIP